ncbi:hypothetical protein K7711_46835 [Nocardia sp. CA2R105]|uniref:hypothetical protein n=1 Tax=Nocardia coffeae TaxID=2873381 RepID=UPI001CA6023A|nr:hypothetical protein [Nocardia coffeae]MBY8864049.1 hypothetical protein [Nocardia coffeae]
MGDKTDSDARLALVEEWLASLRQSLVIGDLTWDSVESDLRSLAVNYIVRRQLEALEASVVLVKAGFGHLAVGFVRPALDELLWIDWIKDLPRAEAHELLSDMGSFDGVRSLVAQRGYAGDQVMQQLWYPVALLDAAAEQEKELKGELKKRGKALGWGNSAFPTSEWVAERTGRGPLFQYLHSATSRSLHFSMGEAMRNGWGEPGGILTTIKPEFRSNRSDFALYQLPRLFSDTLVACDSLREAAGLEFEVEDEGERFLAASENLTACGAVPLVHAHEWNLGPDGPLGSRAKKDDPSQGDRSSS